MIFKCFSQQTWNKICEKNNSNEISTSEKGKHIAVIFSILETYY
jgi:hypothetical protein